MRPAARKSAAPLRHDIRDAGEAGGIHQGEDILDQRLNHLQKSLMCYNKNKK